MILQFLLYFFLLILNASPSGAAVTFQNNHKIIKTLEVQDLSQLSKASLITVFEPHEQQNVTYRGYLMRDILQAIYGSEWKKYGEIIFDCTDDYRSKVPVSELLKYDSYLVFAREGSEDFSIINKLETNQKLTLAPLYLVWDNMKIPELRANGASHWPFQIEGLDLEEVLDQFASIAPDTKARETVRKGFIEFRNACTNCHSLNGVGGQKSLELNYPLSVTEYYRPGFLEKFLDDPQKLRHNSPMPRFNPNHPDRQAAIKSIVVYLEYMSQHKKSGK